MTPAALEHIYRVFRVVPHESGEVRVPAGKFFLSNDGFAVLEDQMGLLRHLEGQLPGDVARYVHRLANSMYFEVRNAQDVQDGHWPEVLPEVSPAAEMQAPENKFDVRMPDGKHQSLEWIGDRAFLDGHEVRGSHLESILEAVKNGEARLSRALAEDEDSGSSAFDDLSKAEKPQFNALQAAMAELKKASQAGHIHPDVYNSLRREIYQDALTPELGNYRSHQDFLTRPRPGIHVHLDANSFGGINKIHGHHVGNQAIQALGTAIRTAIDGTVGQKQAKAWRVGGDEFRVHVPSHEHAAMFTRKLREHLEKIPPIGGTHQLSFSVGFGHTPEHAESALLDAKKAKAAGGHAPGKEPTYAASRIPGREGLLSGS